MSLASQSACRCFVVAWFACTLLLLGAKVTHAQPLSDVIVVPIGISDSTKAIGAASMLEAELTNAHISLISLHDARDRFTARSRPAQMASDSDVDVLAREAREAIEHVAFGRTAAAQRSVREVISRAERTLESLNRETGTARRILDTCLSLVRSTLQTGKRELALEQATRCRRLVPDLAPSEVAHPANVVGVLAEADNLLRRMRTGRLQVLSTPESNCSVYLNGRHLGTTPFQLERAAAGEYRVQVECGRSVGRVHVVQLGDQPAKLRVDTTLDRAVASDPRVALRYESAKDARAHAVSHAVQLGREIGVDDVVLVAIEGERAELMRVQVAQGRLVGRARVGFNERRGFTQPALEHAIATLAEARLDGEPSVDTTPASDAAASSEPAPASAPEAAESAPVSTTPPTPPVAHAPLSAPSAQPGSDAEPTLEPPPDSRARRIAGYALIGGAAVFTALGIGFEWRAQSLRDDLSSLAVDAGDPSADAPRASELQSIQSDWERADKLRWLGVAGSALGLASAVLLVEARSEVPWWSYGLGVVGLGLIGTGAYELVADGRCELRESLDSDEAGPCRRRRDSFPRGIFLLSAGAPFLAVPITHLLRKTAAKELTLLPHIEATKAELTLRFAL